MPATPKPPGQRVRRNRDQKQWRGLPAEGRRGKAPTLPAKRPAWLRATREWWTTIWASPMATAWLPADVPVLIRLARMVERELRGEAVVAELAEMRQLEDRFGLSPRARRLLQWEVANAGVKADEEPEPEQRQLAPVRRLRAVDPRGG